MAWISLLLSLRSLSLALLEPKTWPRRLVDISLALFFGLLALFASKSYDPVVIMIAASLIGLFLIFRLYGLLQANALLKSIKWAAFATFLFLCLLSIATTGFTRLSTDRPIAKVIVTGKQLKKWVEWKTPQSVLCKTWLDTSEVKLETPDGKPIGTYLIYGSLVAVRARTLRFPSLLNFLGIPNICHIDAIYNGYTSMEDHNSLPHIGYPIELHCALFQRLWNTLFYLDWKTTWIKSATLESNYFPLYDQNNQPLCNSYLLTITLGSQLSFRLDNS